jgi:hypothetical protein
MRVLNIEDQNISDAQMRSIQAKTMVIVGDADGVKPEHAVAMFKLRGGGDEEAAATGAISMVPQARLVISLRLLISRSRQSCRSSSR